MFACARGLLARLESLSNAFHNDEIKYDRIARPVPFGSLKVLPAHQIRSTKLGLSPSSKHLFSKLLLVPSA
jgi:hypothetical protein